MSEANWVYGTYNTYYSKTGGTGGSSAVIIQPGPGETLEIRGISASTISQLNVTTATIGTLQSGLAVIGSASASSLVVTSASIGALVGAITGRPTTVTVSQTGHGFSVGTWLYLNGTVYTKADATSTDNAEVVGVVIQVVSVDSFILQDCGYVVGLSGLSSGTVYWLSTAPGALTTSQPTNIGLVSKPLLVADGTGAGFFTNYRGELLVAPPAVQTFGSLYITSSLVVAATTTTTSTASGALVVSGGIGAAAMNVGAVTAGAILITSSAPSASASTGALIVQGGLGLKGDLYEAGIAFTGNGRALYTATAAQLITNNVGGSVLFLATDYNTFGGNLTYSTNGSIFKNVSGSTMFLACSYSIRFSNIPVAAATAPGVGNAWIQKNTTGIFYAQSLVSVSTTSQLGVTGSEIIQLVPNDFIQVLAFQANGPASNVNISANGGANATTFSIYQLP